jgi:hypothetical protein
MLGFFLALARAILRPLPEIVAGVWNITEVSVTADGLSNPDTRALSVSFTSPTNDTFSGLLLGGSRSLPLSIALGENESISVSGSGEKEIQTRFLTSKNGIRYIHGAVDDFAFSFVILSSWRAELTIVDRKVNSVVLYRCVKEYRPSAIDRFSGGFWNFLQNLVFRVL